MGKIEEFMTKQGEELKPNTLKDNAKNITKNKEFKNLSTSEKDRLLEILFKQFGLI